MSTMAQDTPQEVKKRSKWERLHDAIADSREKLQPFREKRLEVLRQFVGKHYGENEKDIDRVPLNMIELATQIYGRRLVARNPKATISTTRRELRASARLLELAVNHRIEEVKLHKTIRRAVMDAIFGGLGVVKCGLNASKTVELEGELMDVGAPYLSTVDLDDLVLDMEARNWDSMSFIGHRVRVPIEQLKNSGLVDEKFFKEGKEGQKAVIRHISKTPMNEDGDERVETLSQGSDGDPDELYDFTEFFIIYLPMEDRVVWLASAGEGGEPITTGDPIRDVEWDGPEGGPFHVLTFTDVPGNMMPLAPSNTWLDLHTIINRLYTKQSRQAERQKTLLTFREGSTSDPERIKNASDGDVIPLANPQDVQEFSTGGVRQENLAFTLSGIQQFDFIAGNLSMLGGLSPQSDTLGQDQLLAASAGVRIEDMQSQVYDFTQGLVKTMAFYLWYDPFIQIPLSRRISIGGREFEAPFVYGDEHREGDFLDYNFSVAVYSMQEATPAQKLRTVMEILNSVIMPLGEAMAAQGMALDIAALLRVIGKTANLPELDEIIMSAQPVEQEGPVQTGAMGYKPAKTERTYTRRTTPGTTRNSQLGAQISAMMGSRQQPAEAAAGYRNMG